MATELLFSKGIEAEEKNHGEFPNIFLLIALCIDLFTPFLIWKGIIPAQARWISHAAVAIMVLGSIARIIVFKHLPRSFLLLLSVSILWSFVALMRGQGITATIWGIWEFVPFPFVGLFIYLQPSLPRRISSYLYKSGLTVLFLQVAIQAMQYATGEKPGDNLAGLFGRNGTSNAVFFIFILTCIFLGHWIVTKQWRGLVFTLILGAISSVLAEVKLFPFVTAGLSGLAIVFFAIRFRSIIKLAKYGVLVAVVLVIFAALYNTIIPSSSRRPIQAFITDPQMLDSYLNQSQVVYKNGDYRTMMGRNLAFSVGWDTILQDPITLLFGFGIGARSESQTLQTTGIGFDASGTGVNAGTSLLIMMQEMGVVGLTVLGGFLVWVIVTLIMDIRRRPDSPVLELRYAVLLFSLFWPVWLWYSSSWHMRVPMLLYWALLGYVFAEERQPLKRLQPGFADVLR